MNDLLCVPLKKTADIDLIRPLKNLIHSTYSRSDTPVSLQENLSELQRLRQSAIKHDRGEASFFAIANYYDQLIGLEQKIQSNEIQIAFKWRSAFDKSSVFGGRSSLTLPSMGYEKICTLFNLGAISSIVASSYSNDSEGMQKAIKKLQLAAGIFTQLREIVVGIIQTNPTPDLEPDTLSVLAEIMTAQAQEIVIAKAINDKMKDQIIAKLCSQCEELYANVMKTMQKENLRSIWDSSWLPNVCGKQAIYNGMTQYHQSRVCNASKAIGEEIARLEYAKTLFTAGKERGKNPSLCNTQEWLKKTERYLAEAKKDNDFIFHERIPDIKNLSIVSKAIVAKPMLPLPSPMGNSGKDLFESLCPIAVHQALSVFDGRKQEIINREVTTLKNSTARMNELLSSMNLPAAIEDTSGNSVPDSLVSKANAVKEAGGMETITKLIKELPDLLTRNTEILDECERMLKEEHDSDSQLRNQFKEKWTRTASNQLTSTFDANAKKYRTIINNAKQADGIVKEKLNTHQGGIETLGKGGSSLNSTIPSSGNQLIKGSPIVAKLRNLMEDVETLKAERLVVESELKSANPNVKPLFFEALNKNGVISEQEISIDCLDRTFGPMKQMVSESVSRQEKLMEDIRQSNEQFLQESGSGNNTGSARDDTLKQLAAAHDAFFELKGNLQEGTKFYNDLTQLLVTFQNKVSDFCFARKTEKEELLKDLTSGIANMKIDAGPTPPAHHTAEQPERPARKNDPPPRPQQPAVNPYAGAPAQPMAATAPPQQPYAPNPYAGAPYPPMEYTPMPTGYNPYGAPPPPANYMPYPPQYPVQQPYGYPPQPQVPYQSYPGYPYPQQPGPNPPK